MIKIFHNNRCSKSRCGLAILEESGQKFEIINYLTDTPTVKDIRNIIKRLNIKPIELVRKNEAIWKADYKSLTLSDDAVIEAMAQHPKLIERPIVINGNKAVIGRPPELILSILD